MVALSVEPKASLLNTGLVSHYINTSVSLGENYL